MRTSYSALDTFKTCPLQYKLQNIDKIKTPKTPQQVFGTIVHDALNYMFERNPLYPTVDEVINHYLAGWKSAAEKIAWTDLERKDAEQKMYVEEGLAIIKSFAKKNSPWNFNAVELESRFSLDILDDETGETHTLAGIMDRLDKDPDSSKYEIIDYKTGKKMPSVEMLEDNLQLGLYSLVIVDRWPHIIPEDVTVSLYFLKHNEKVSTTMTREKLERTKRHILAMIREVEKRTAEDDFPPTPSALCGWCGFRPLCPMWAHEYRKEDQPAPNEDELKHALSDFFAIKDLEDAQKKRVAALKDVINRYMDAQGFERVFSDEGYVTRSAQERVTYDMAKAEPILRAAGVWNEVLAPDKKKLEEVLETLGDKEQREIEDAKKVSVSKTLRISKKKTAGDEEDEEATTE
ncbi:MAG: PD-(D/E)XK nuclease family protein [Candidatus Yonathbacteria bacterium]|nr:PD-(D/E)XK nuclease family protein [Candidatus Yonathbacteria bacterium]